MRWVRVDVLKNKKRVVVAGGVFVGARLFPIVDWSMSICF
jgi:hypothetical protein